MQLCWTEETDLRRESSFFLVKMFDDYFFLYTFQHVWLTKFLAADRPSRPPVHLLWSPYRSVRTYISSDTKEENLLKKNRWKN